MFRRVYLRFGKVNVAGELGGVPGMRRLSVDGSLLTVDRSNWSPSFFHSSNLPFFRSSAVPIRESVRTDHAFCHHNYIGYVERGEQNLTIDMLVRLAKALKCSAEDLAGDAGI